VMVIIGVLAGFVLLNIQSSLGRARDAQRKNDLKQIQTALQLYHSDYGKYPASWWVNSTSATSPWIPGLTANYIKTMPVDPKNSGCISNTSNPRDDSPPNCFTYAYYSSTEFCNLSGVNDGYILVTRLEQYQGSDLSQKPYYNTDGTPCFPSAYWSENPVSGLYTVSNP